MYICSDKALSQTKSHFPYIGLFLCYLPLFISNWLAYLESPLFSNKFSFPLVQKSPCMHISNEF